MKKIKSILLCFLCFSSCFFFGCQEKKLLEISVTKEPDKVAYYEGEVFDNTGLEITASYSDGSSNLVLEYTYSTEPLTLATESVLISYTESDITKTVAIAITVSSNTSSPVISVEPRSLEGTVGSYLELKVTASNATHYRWYVNTVSSTTGATLIDDATNSTLIVDTSEAGTLYYYVVITNEFGSALSEIVFVKLLEDPNTPVITKQPESLNVSVFEDATLSVTATGSGVLTYQWYRNGTDNPALIEGATSNTYNAPTDSVAITNYHCVITNTSGDIIKTVASNTVTVIVGPKVDTGEPVITKTEVIGSNEVGSQLELRVSATTEVGILSYEWYKSATNSNANGTLISGETRSFYYAPSTKAGMFYYYCVVTSSLNDNGDGGIKEKSVTSEIFEVEIVEVVDASTPIILSQPQSVTLSLGDVYELAVHATTDSGVLTYQWYSAITNNMDEAILIDGANQSTYLVPTDTVGGLYYYCRITNTNNDVNGQKVAVVDSELCAINVNNLVNAKPAVITLEPIGKSLLEGEMLEYTLKVEATPLDSGLLTYQWYQSSNSNALHYGNPMFEETNNTLVLDTTNTGVFYYYCQITNTITDNGDGGLKTIFVNSDTVLVSVAAIVDAMLPIFIDEPIDQVGVIGDTLRLTVQALAIDGGVLSFQWVKFVDDSDLVEIPGANNSYLDITLSELGNVYYGCVVTNTNNSVNGLKSKTASSHFATVKTVELLDASTPIINKQPMAMNLDEGDSYTLSTSASISDLGTLSYQWYSKTSLDDDGILIAGATSSSLYLTNLLASNSYYYCLVTNTNNSVNGQKSVTQTTNIVLVSVARNISDLEENIKTLINAINALPSVNSLDYSYDRGLVKYLMAEYQKLALEDQELINNYQKLADAFNRINELEQSYEFDVMYNMAGWPYPDNWDPNNPNTYKISDGAIVLNDPIFEDDEIVFVEWREEATNIVITTLQEAFELNKYDYFRISAIFEEAIQEVTINYLDSITEEVLYSVNVLENSGRYSLLSDSDHIASLNGVYPISFLYNYSHLDFIDIYNISGAINVIVETTELRIYNFSSTDSYKWRGNWYYGETMLSTTLKGNETKVYLPVYAILNISILDNNITDMKFNDEVVLSNSTGYSDLVVSGPEVLVSFVAVQESVRVVFLHGTSVQEVLVEDSATWDGLLSSELLNHFGERFMDTAESYFEYCISETVAMNISELAEYVFPHQAGDVTIVTISAVINMVNLNVGFFNGGSAINTQINTEETIALNLERNPLLQFIFTNMTLFTDYSKNHIYEVDMNGYITTDLALYLAKNNTFTISYETDGGSSLNPSIMSANDYSYSIFELPIPIKEGYLFSGYSLTPNGEIFNSTEFALIMTHYNQNVLLYAHYDEAIDTSTSELLGLWGILEGQHGRYIYFDHNGTGKIIELMLSSNPNTYLNNEFRYYQEDGAVIITYNGLEYVYQLSEIISDNAIGLDGIFYGTYHKIDSDLLTFFITDLEYGRSIRNVTIPDYIVLSEYTEMLYYLGSHKLDTTKPLRELLNNGDYVSEMNENFESNLVFITYELNGGVIERLPIEIFNSEWSAYLSDLATPVRGSDIFMGWYTEDNVVVTSHNFDSLIAGTTNLTLYAHYYSTSNIDYSDYDFVGVWSLEDYGPYAITNHTLIFNADGTYSYLIIATGYDGSISQDLLEGYYEYTSGMLNILTGDENYYLTDNTDIRFVSDNLIIANNYLMTKGPVRNVDYQNEDFIGEYEVYAKTETSGLYQASRALLFLNDNGTFTYAAYQENSEDSPMSLIQKGYYRFLDGEIFFLNMPELSSLLRVAKHQDEEIDTQFLGTWYAKEDDLAAQELAPYIKFNENAEMQYATLYEGMLLTITSSCHYENQTATGLVPLENSIALMAYPSNGELLVYVWDFISNSTLMTLHYVR